MSFAYVRRFLTPALLLSFVLTQPSPGRAQEEQLEGVQDTQPDTDDLSTLKIFNQVVLLVKDNYVDPRRIHPKEMMTAALDYVQRTVADVIIENNALETNPELGHAGPDSGHVRVTVGAATKDFDVSDVDTLWKLSFRLKDIFSFMQGHLSKTDKTKDIEYAAVAGMLSTLDPHSVFLTTESYHEMKLQTKGEFGGLGFVISMKDSNLTVVHVLPNTPAKRAGIKPKDRVIKIEERSTVNMDLNDAVSKLRGKPGSKVHITVARASWPQPKRLDADPRGDPDPERLLQAAGERGAAAGRDAGQELCRRRPHQELPEQHRARSAAGHLGPAAAGQGEGRPAGRGGARPARQPRRAPRAGHPGHPGLRRQGHHRDHGGALGQAARGQEGPRRARGRKGHSPGRAGRLRLRLGLRDRQRGPQEPEPRSHRRPPDVRQGLGPGALRLRRRHRAQADHRAVPHARRHLDPGGRHHPRHRARSGPHRQGEEGPHPGLRPPQAPRRGGPRAPLRQPGRERQGRREARGRRRKGKALGDRRVPARDPQGQTDRRRGGRSRRARRR